MCVEISTNHQYNHWGFTDDLTTEGKDDGEKSTNFFCLILIVFVLCVSVVAQMLVAMFDVSYWHMASLQQSCLKCGPKKTAYVVHI